MTISLGIIFGLTAAVSWGVADFAARFASRRTGAYRSLFFMQIIGFLALSIWLERTGGISRGVPPGWHPWMLAAAAGVLNVGALLALYHAFEVGVMSVVAPVSSSYPALTVALALLSGERISVLRGAGLALTVTGVVLAAMSFAPDANRSISGAKSRSGSRLSKGVGPAIFSAVGFGVMFWFLGFYVIPVVGSAASVWVLRLTGFVALALVAGPARQSLRPPRGSVWWLLLLIGLADTGAFVANTVGLHVGPISVVSVLTSLYGAVTVLLSWIFLRERLERSQWFGIALIFTGVVLVSV